MFADKELCKQCGACFSECPYQLIVEDKEGFPKLRLAAKKTCIGCGHCVAVCPVSALTLPDLPVAQGLSPAQCIQMVRDNHVTIEQADQFLEEPPINQGLQEKDHP